ncbi:MAG: Paraquat-inducible protein A [Verrucomicrobiae bacterium]|nr:Paraquat-inducible protein A [Verrucomicrobiae bacterium]
MKKSLKDIYPRRIEVPLLILVSQVLFFIAVCLPLMHVEKQLLWKRWRNEYSVITGVVGLFEQREHFLAAVLFFFSVVFPLVKLTLLWGLWLLRLPEERRQALLRWLGILGKWSMLDVFVVAMLIVLVKLGPVVRVEAQPGVYVFAMAILLSMISTMYMTYLAKKQ